MVLEKVYVQIPVLELMLGSLFSPGDIRGLELLKDFPKATQQVCDGKRGIVFDLSDH